MSGLLDHHPGGKKVILSRAGKEASETFKKGEHPYHVLEHKLPKMAVGRIGEDSMIASSQREFKTGKMDIFCASSLALGIISTFVFLAI